MIHTYCTYCRINRLFMFRVTTVQVQRTHSNYCRVVGFFCLQNVTSVPLCTSLAKFRLLLLKYKRLLY